MKAKPIKQEVRSFALKLRKAVIAREKYQESREPEWFETVASFNYIATTDALQELWQSVSEALDELHIDIPLLK